MAFVFVKQPIGERTGVLPPNSKKFFTAVWQATIKTKLITY
jgi:hypothetical protein